MRAAVVVGVLVAGGCESAGKLDIASKNRAKEPVVAPTSPQDPEPEPMRPPPPVQSEPCPPGAQKFEIRAPVVIADKIRVFHDDMPVRWIAQDGHLHELAADPLAPIEPCDESLGMWADARGLFWLRGNRFFSKGDRLYFLPWSALEPR